MEEPIYPAAVSHYSNQVVPEYPVLLSGIEQVMEEDYYKHMYSVGGLGEVPADFAQQVVEQQGKLIGKKVIDADWMQIITPIKSLDHHLCFALELLPPVGHPVWGPGISSLDEWSLR